ncbi:MAG: alpha-amylase [Chitinivibrionales bacterium]|nr:alpha-amylase [Chitinivibrionales bacterium]
MKKPPILFNLFPRHFASIEDWEGALPHIGGMEFNYVFVNPFHATGFSGSLYAVRDYYQLNPAFLSGNQQPHDFGILEAFINQCESRGLSVIMDLVINHTAKDSPLVDEKPHWYQRTGSGKVKSPSAIDPANADNVTVWGDLAELDYTRAKDELTSFFDEVVGFYQNLGIKGFRCDAAYQVPADAWKVLIGSAKQRDADAFFLAETLGCRLEEIESLYGCGFDYLFNSSKYWNYDEPWCLQQHEENQAIAPSISFPESHDTERLAAWPPKSEEMQKSRYVMAALFSEGLMMPMGYEFGATKRIDVVSGTPDDLEKPHWDLVKWIKSINQMKKEHSLLHEEGHWRALSDYSSDILFLEKSSGVSDEKLVICVNKDWYAQRRVVRNDFPAECADYASMIRPFASTSKKSLPDAFDLVPNEIALFVG